MVELLKAGAETDKEDADGKKALDLVPDKEVRSLGRSENETPTNLHTSRSESISRGRERAKASKCSAG